MSAGTYLVGTSGWSYDPWRGRFYPEELSKAEWLEYYTRHFPVVEVNATFYHAFDASVYERWRETAPEGFRFVLKVPRWITHEARLQNVEVEIAEFWNSATVLGDRLALVLLQLAPSMPYDPLRLREALLAFGDPSRVVVEVRRAPWYTGEVRRILARLGAVLCNTDAPDSPLTEWLTSDVGYLRLHGRKAGEKYAYAYTKEELEGVAEVARRLTAEGARQVYVLFNNTMCGAAPHNARELLARLEPGFTSP